MEMKVFKCTSCQAPMKYGKDSAGRKTQCPKCGKDVLLPKNQDDGPPAGGEDGEGGYKLQFVDDAAEKKKRQAAEAEKTTKKLTAKVKIRRKNIGDMDSWRKVYNGLLFIMIGACLWGAAYGLQMLVLFLGMIQGPEIGMNAEKHLFVAPPPPAEPGVWFGLDRAMFLVGMLGGSDFAGTARVLLIVSQVLTFIQLAMWMVGYGMCLAIEDRLGSRGQLITLFSFSGVNLLLNMFFRFLPLLGVVGYVLVPFFAPELAMGEANTERAQAINVTWSAAPMWEIALAVLVQASILLEPILIGVFIWTIAQMVRDIPLEERALGLIKMGFGIFFLVVAYQMYTCAGTSSVLIKLLRVIYLIWFGFQIGFIVKLATISHAAREVLNFYLNPEE